MSVTQSRLNASHASASTPRGPSSDHSAISTAPVSEPGADRHAVARRQLKQLVRASDGQRGPRLGVGLAMIAADQRALEPVHRPAGMLGARPRREAGIVGADCRLLRA